MAPQKKDLPPVSLPLFLLRSGSNARGESRALEGRRVSSKSPSRVRDGDEGVARRNVRERIIFLIKATHTTTTQKAQISKIPIFRALETTTTPKKQKFRKFPIFGLATQPLRPKKSKFRNFQFFCWPDSLPVPKNQKFRKFQWTGHHHMIRGHTLEKKKAPAQLPIHLLPPPPHCPHSVHWWLCWCDKVLTFSSPVHC